MEFLTANLPLILFFLSGFALLIAEAFMPGFGVAGVLGIALEICAVYCAWQSHGTLFALILALVIIVMVVVTIVLSYRSAMHGRLSKSELILNDVESAGAETEAEKLAALKDREGVAATPLRPGGTVEIDGQTVRAASAGDLIPKGTRVRVTGVEGDHVTVRPVG